jgi:DNA (cytosine-5)-methyltransferase 1
MSKKLNYIDLFAGAGGLSEGFIKAGYNPIAHVEMDQAACYTLKTRVAFHYLKSVGKLEIYKDYLKGEINRTQLYSFIPATEKQSVINLPLGDENNQEIFKRIDNQLEEKKVDIIIGGPPCQAYSLVGRARSKDGMKSDSRNHLYLQYAEYLKKYEPKIFVFENVLGLLSAGNGTYYTKMVEAFEALGYKVKPHVLNARDFGVLQNRKRVILIGYQEKLHLSIPALKLEKKEEHQVKAIFEDLPHLFCGEGCDKNGKYKRSINAYLEEAGIRNGIDVLTQHVCRPHTNQDKKIYRIAVESWQKSKRLTYTDLPAELRTHNNTTSFFDRFKVVADNLSYSQTVVAHIAKDGHYYIHPDINQNRSISVREAARLQSFPDDYYFEGVKEGRFRTAAFKQIGNAVPPLMAKSIADILRELLKNL